MSASENQNKFLLHNAIVRDDLDLFRYLLYCKKPDVDQQNKDGETPLLLCLKLNRRDEFIESLFEYHCNVRIYDYNMVTPLRLALKHSRFGIAALLINRLANVYEEGLTIKEHIIRAVLGEELNFVASVVDSGMDLSKMFLPVLCSLAQRDSDVEQSNEAKAALKILEVDWYLSKMNLPTIGESLFLHALELPTSKLLKFLWPNLDHKSVSRKKQPHLLARYLLKCKFVISEYVDCLCMIVSSPHAFCYVDISNHYRYSGIETTFFCHLFEIFQMKQIKQHDRLVVISHCLKSVKVTKSDIVGGYWMYGFNEEVTLLIQFFPVECLANNKEGIENLMQFILYLEGNLDFSIYRLNKLGLVARLCYRRLLNAFPVNYFDRDGYENIKIKRNILNNTPTLFEFSLHQFQKCLQQFYKIDNTSQFNKMVNNLAIPRTVKSQLGYKPPVYVENKEKIKL